MVHSTLLTLPGAETHLALPCGPLPLPATLFIPHQQKRMGSSTLVRLTTSYIHFTCVLQPIERRKHASYPRGWAWKKSHITSAGERLPMVGGQLCPPPSMR